LLPCVCDGCCASFTVEHALDCRVGGLVTQHHNEIRDAIGDLLTLAWGQVQREPVVCDASETLVADLRVRGVWQHQADAIFYVRALMHDLIDLDHCRLCFKEQRVRKNKSAMWLV